MPERRLRLELDWDEQGEDVAPVECRATLARLTVRVDGTVVNAIEFDEDGRNVQRNHTLLPVYPMAEWLACNWWQLLYEVPSNRDAALRDYERRHNLRSGSEGYAHPFLLIEPDGVNVRLQWKPYYHRFAHCSFTTVEGEAVLPFATVRDELKDFVQHVDRRLYEKGVRGTVLQDELVALQEAERDDEVGAFCRAAGRLGHDPYSMPDELRESLLGAAGKLPAGVLDEALCAVETPRLRAEVSALESLTKRRLTKRGDGTLPRIRAALGSPDRTGLPWEVGYRLADRFRRELKLPADRPVTSIDSLPAAVKKHCTLMKDVPEFTEALMVADDSARLDLVIQHSNPQTAVFRACRALCEFLSAQQSENLALVTPSRSWKQKRGRAFAAQLILPAKLLKKRLDKPILTSEQISDIASDLKVSEWIVGHQIKNHQLARIKETD